MESHGLLFLKLEVAMALKKSELLKALTYQNGVNTKG